MRFRRLVIAADHGFTAVVKRRLCHHQHFWSPQHINWGDFYFRFGRGPFARSFALLIDSAAEPK
jgi:hypothetical protein